MLAAPLPEPDRKLTLTLPAAVLRQLRQRMADDDTTMRALVLEALQQAGYAVPEVEIPEGYGSAPHDKVYVCKYVGKPGEGGRLATGDNPLLVNYNENWDGQTLFLDAQGYSFVIALKDTPGPGPEPEPVCPEPAPHVWLSN